MKYRIAHLYNGNYLIQRKKHLFSRWETLPFEQNPILSSVTYQIREYQKEDQKIKDIKTGNKICKFIY